MDPIGKRNVASELAELTTVGNRIVTTQNRIPVRLCGVNYSGFEYNPVKQVHDDEFDQIAAWGANIVRLPFNQDWALHSESYLGLVDRVICMAAERGIYTLLDLQWLDAIQPRGYLEDGRPNFVPALPDHLTVELWRKLAARYSALPHVLYDIFNEPHEPLAGDPTCVYDLPGQWHAAAARLIATVRCQHPRALIFVSGLDWGYDLSSFPLADMQGVVYSSHVYPRKRMSWLRAFGRLSKTHPVFIGECGGEDADVRWGQKLLQYLDERELGYTAWSWCDHPHLVRSSDPTHFGELVRSHLLLQSDS